MTHSTDQDRTEFEAWWCTEMNVEVMDLERTAYPMTPPEKQLYKCHETERAWLSWQAARRAQVVLKCSECEDTGVGVSHGYDCTSCYGEFPAAPQPPEAAPVQMPEPDCFAFQHSDGTWHDVSHTRHSAGMKSLHTEHQVRQLLAAQAKEKT